jgi:hypothetical protein
MAVRRKSGSCRDARRVRTPARSWQTERLHYGTSGPAGLPEVAYALLPRLETTAHRESDQRQEQEEACVRTAFSCQGGQDAMQNALLASVRREPLPRRLAAYSPPNERDHERGYSNISCSSTPAVIHRGLVRSIPPPAERKKAGEHILCSPVGLRWGDSLRCCPAQTGEEHRARASLPWRTSCRRGARATWRIEWRFAQKCVCIRRQVRA